MIVYKYVQPARINVLENSMIRFTQPGDLNDPFETNVSDIEYRRDLETKQLEENRRRFAELGASSDVADAIHADLFAHVLPEEYKKKINETTLILSLTKTPNNLLMWSHYADQHQGFVIGFNADCEFFQNETKYVIPLREVQYSEVRYQLPVGASPGTDLAVATAWRDALLLTKSTAWSYEEELRIVSSPYVADHTNPARGGRFPLCLFDFPPDCIAEIIMGANMLHTNREKIVEIMRLKYPNAKLLQAQLDEYKFDLKFVSVS